MSDSRRKALLISLACAVVAAIGTAVFISVALAVLLLYLSGHNRDLWGYGRHGYEAAYHWPDILLIGGVLLAALFAGTFVYRARRGSSTSP